MECSVCGKDVSQVQGFGEYPNDTYMCLECIDNELSATMASAVVVISVILFVVFVLVFRSMTVATASWEESSHGQFYGGVAMVAFVYGILGSFLSWMIRPLKGMKKKGNARTYRAESIDVGDKKNWIIEMSSDGCRIFNSEMNTVHRSASHFDTACHLALVMANRFKNLKSSDDGRWVHPTSDCPECGSIYGHSIECSLSSYEYRLRQIRRLSRMADHFRERFASADERAKSWEGKFRILAHENNVMRERLRRTRITSTSSTGGMLETRTDGQA